MKRYFVTGTDTDTGKTLISSALLLKAQQQGMTTFGLKPVAAGCELTNSGNGTEWQNEDAQLLRQYSTEQQPYKVHNPVALQAAIAPHIAAEMENSTLSLDQLLADCQPGLAVDADFQLIEGAGGWLVPLNKPSSGQPGETLADFATHLATQFDAEVILVVGLRLGCINHALLSAQMIQHSGVKIAGWVANSLSENMEAQAGNLEFLSQWFSSQQIPMIGHTPFIAGIDRFNPDQLQQIAKCLHLAGDD